MDFNDTPEEAAYRAQVRDLAGSQRRPSAPSAAMWKARRRLHAGLQGLAGQEGRRRLRLHHLAQGMGRAGRHPIQQVIFNQEEAKYPIPPNPFQIGLGMCVPTVTTFADAETKARFVGPALRGEEIWCQLFSEPSGGSDVAAARTKAVRAPDGSGDWIIDGQKVWTTGAQFSSFGIVITRTDPDAPKHKGMTMFWVDMNDPGVEVRPIHQMSGGVGLQRGVLHRRSGEGQPAAGRGQ